MRHATDPDHVIAVTTIVARQRRVGAAALIGVLWGIGHTLTMVAVGGAIIVFGVVIPPRLGLTMELSVALMLILLGVANLAGIMRWITGTWHEEVFDVHPHRHGGYVHSHAHGETPRPAGMSRTTRRARASIGGRAASASTRPSGRSSWGWCTGSRGRRRSRCSCWPPSRIRSGGSPTCSCSGWARSRA